MKKIIIIGMMLTLLGALLGCSEKEAKPEEGGYYIYYTNVNGSGLERASYEAKNIETQPLIDELLEQLSITPDNSIYFLLLPDNVTIDHYEYVDNNVTLNMSESYHEMVKSREVIVRAGLVRTLTQIQGVDTVRIYVAGEPLTNSKGIEIGPMTADTFVENSGKEINSYENATLTLYYANGDGTKLNREARKLYYSSNVPLERVVVEQLVTGPKVEGNNPVLSPNSSILGVTVADNTCYVNFGSKFAEEAQNVQQELPIYAIVNSLIDNCAVSQVQISIDGESNRIFRESMDLNQFYTKNTEVIAE